jgi:hypothetical protein
MTHSPNDDATGKNAEQRFVELRKYFLDCLVIGGQGRKELYFRPKPGEAREPTEEELVRKWAQTLAVPVNEICIGIQRAFALKAEMGQAVVNFRECVPQIQRRMSELREARAKEGWQ